jgi:hypothetical protein
VYGVVVLGASSGRKIDNSALNNISSVLNKRYSLMKECSEKNAGIDVLNFRKNGYFTKKINRQW